MLKTGTWVRILSPQDITGHIVRFDTEDSPSYLQYVFVRLDSTGEIIRCRETELRKIESKDSALEEIQASFDQLMQGLARK
jgi:hypothetical protein